MLNETIQRRSYSVTLPCEYLLHVPPAIDSLTPLIICLHGYGMNPLDMLRLTAMAVGPNAVLASARAPHAFYAPGPGADATVGYNWGVAPHWEHAVHLHHSMLMALLNSLGSELEISSERTFLLGFSQPVGLNYRFIATYPGLVRGVIGLCGGVPRDWEESKYQKIDAAILHISRDEDEFYPTARSLEFPERLRRYAADVEFHMIPGAHRFPSRASGVIQTWIAKQISRKIPS